MGKRERACELWQEAYSCDPENSAISGCLDEFDDEDGCVYAFSMFDIVPGGLERFKKELKNGKEDDFLKRNSDLLAALLTLGDSWCVELSVMALGMGDLLVCEPELTSFVQGRRGSSKLRMSAAHILAAKSGKTRFTMWFDGEARELEMKKHTPREVDHTPAVFRELEKTTALLHSQKFTQAEKALRTALRKFPDEPTLWNNLGAAVSSLGRSKESRQIAEQIVERFPEYPFGRINLAKLNILEGRAADAMAILRPLSERNDLHPDEIEAWQRVCELITASEKKVGNG